MVLGALTCMVLAGLPSAAWAHGDARLLKRTLTIPAGGSATFEGDVHYHRLVGTVRADGLVTMTLIRDSAQAPVIQLGPARVITLNELVACCDDDPWSPHQLVIHNPAEVPVVADADLALVHDDLAVMVFTAEAGTRESIPVLGALWVAALWWAVRRRASATLRAATLRLGIVAAATATFAGVGALRYGTGGPPALVAALSDVPVLPINPIVSRPSLLIGLLIAGWAWAGVRWASAAPSADTAAWLAVGLALLAAPIVTAVLVVTAYGPAGIATASAVAAALPVAGVLVMRQRRPARTTAPEAAP